MKRFLYGAVVCGVALTLASCTSLQQSLSWTPEGLFKKRTEVSVQRDKLQASGDYLGALQVCKRNRQLCNAGIVRGAYAQAQSLQAEGKYAEAGEGFAALVPFSAQSAGKGDISRSRLTEQMNACAEQLMVQGMGAYRDGRLDEAIATWESILTFSPGHEAALKSLHTCRIQLSNLRSLEKESP